MRQDEAQVKAERVAALMEREALDVLVLRTPASAAWWSGGGRTHLEATPHLGLADLVLTRDGDRVATRIVTQVHEVDRLREEELGALDAEWEVLPWWQPRDAVLPRGPRVGSDVPLDGCRLVDAGGLRAPLLPAEQERLRAVGSDAARALTVALSVLDPGASETAAAALVSAALVDVGVDPVVLQVAGGERLARYRHVLASPAGPAGPAAMVSVCGRRHGLVVSLTRFVVFEPPSEDWQDAHRRIRAVDGAALSASRPGRRVGDVFDDVVAAYAAHGFAADEWTRHHQGGLAGYAPRELVATAAADRVVAVGDAVAWNPSAAGVKSEDTALVGTDGTEVVTVDPEWPVDGAGRPMPLPR